MDKNRETKIKNLDKKEFSNLDLYIWNIKYLPSKKWNKEIFIYGSDSALEIIVN